MEEDLELTAAQIQRMPYVLLVDPSGQNAVAYNAQHRVLVERASPRLIAWALQHHRQVADWDDKLDEHWQRERPSWLPAGSLAGWRLLWLRGAGTTDAQIRSTPKR